MENDYPWVMLLGGSRKRVDQGYVRSRRGRSSDREVDDIQSIEQPLTESAARDAIQKRDRRGRDESDCVR